MLADLQSKRDGCSGRAACHAQTHVTCSDEPAKSEVHVLKVLCPSLPVRHYKPRTLNLKAARPCDLTNVDLNEDGPLRTSRMGGFCEFTSRKRRPQRGCTTSDAQIARLLQIYESQTSTSTRIDHFACPQREASANLESQTSTSTRMHHFGSPNWEAETGSAQDQAQN